MTLDTLRGKIKAPGATWKAERKTLRDPDGEVLGWTCQRMWSILGVVVPVLLKKTLRTRANLTRRCVNLTLGPPQASCGPREKDRPHLRSIPQLPGRFRQLRSLTGLTPRASLSLSNALSGPPLSRSARAGRERPPRRPMMKRKIKVTGKWPKGDVAQLAVTSA